MLIRERLWRPIAPIKSLLAATGERPSHACARSRAVTLNLGGIPQWSDDSHSEPAVYITSGIR